MRKLVATFVVVATLILSLPALAQDQTATAAAEVKAEVPALTAMHDVIYPLWHEAWPNKNAKMIKELLPQVQKDVAAVEAAQLPGILRDRQAAWSIQIEALRATLADLEKAVAADNTQAMLDAVEALHGRYEQMVRVIRPVMQELEAYHQVLYVIYHRVMPEKKLADMPKAAADLSAACVSLTKAPVPKRYGGLEAQLKEQFAALCTTTDALKAVAGSGDAAKISAAVESVHTKYQEVAGIFQ